MLLLSLRAWPRLALLLLLVSSTRPAAAAELSEPARWLREYLRIDTTNPPGDEHRTASYLAYLLHRERIPTRLLATPDGRANLYARLEADDPQGGPLLLTHHMDVVPAGPGWRVEPFAGTAAEGRLWGRGALDSKGLGIAHLAGFIDLKRRGRPLNRDVIFLAVADEEQGGQQGMGWIFQHYPELVSDVWAVLNEGGASRAGASGLLWWEVEVAQKRPLWLRVRTRGWGGHGSAYNPESALHQLIAALDRLLALPPRYRVTQAVRDYGAAIAPLHRNQYHRELFAHLDDQITPEGPKGLLLPGLHKLFLDTVQVTVIEGGESINVVAEEASALLDVRLLPDTDAEAFLQRVREALGEQVEVEVLLEEPPAPPSPTDHPVYRAVAEVLEEWAPVVPSMLAGFSDSRFFRARGIPAYGVSPFALTGAEAGGVHGTDEGIDLLELERGAERMARIVAACATGSSDVD